MIKLLSPIILVGLLSCQDNPFDKDNDPKEPIVYDEELVVEKRKLYLSESKKHADENGFVHGGDGMLFSCLRYVAGGKGVRWQESHVEGDPYWMIRKKGHEPKGKKWSYYSNDMLVGEMFCIWESQDLEFIEGRIEWLEDHDWDHCGGREYADPYTIWKTRCKTSWNIKSTLYELRYQLGGESHPDRFTHIQVWNPWSESFPTHLTMLQMLLRGTMQRGVNDNQLDFMSAKVRDNPGNSLYGCIHNLFTDGNMDIPIAQLMDEEGRFPADHLPTSDNYCTEYLFQREQYQDKSGPMELTKDWKPCSEEDKEHDGTDFLFASSVCLGMIK